MSLDCELPETRSALYMAEMSVSSTMSFNTTAAPNLSPKKAPLQTRLRSFSAAVKSRQRRTILQALDQLFLVSQRGSTFSREITGGLLMFVCTLYILTVHPAIQSGKLSNQLNQTGYSNEQIRGLTTSTALVSGLATSSMGLFSNTPIMIAPAMGLNSYFIRELVPIADNWSGALTVSFIASVVHLCIMLLLLTTRSLNLAMFVIPFYLRMGVTLGIGLMVAFISLRENSGIGLFTVTNKQEIAFPAVLRPEPFLGMLGVVIVVSLRRHEKLRNVAPLISVFLVTIISLVVGSVQGQTLLKRSEWGDTGMGSLMFKCFHFSSLDYTSHILWFRLLTLVIHKLFDSLLTLLAMAHTHILSRKLLKGGVWNEMLFSRQMAESRTMGRILVTDAVWNVIAGMFGLSTSTMYIESFVAFASGASTGIAAIVCGLLFLASSVLYPLVKLVPSEAYGVALLLSVTLFFNQVQSVDFLDLRHSLPLLLAALTIPLTADISLGVSIGFLISFVSDVLDRSVFTQLSIALVAANTVDHNSRDMTSESSTNSTSSMGSSGRHVDREKAKGLMPRCCCCLGRRYTVTCGERGARATAMAMNLAFFGLCIVNIISAMGVFKQRPS